MRPARCERAASASPDRRLPVAAWGKGAAVAATRSRRSLHRARRPRTDASPWRRAPSLSADVFEPTAEGRFEAIYGALACMLIVAFYLWWLV